MKNSNFFDSFLGSLAAIWASAIIGVILFFVFIGAIVAAAVGGSETKTDARVLKITLEGAIPERVTDLSVQDLLSGAEPVDFGLDDLLNSIYLAADDKNIEGIYLDCAGSALGIASREELLEALKAFRATGKWIYAYADTYGQGDYYVATAADSIVVNPSGMVDVRGIAAQVVFYKDLMEKLGVEMQIVKVGSYKSAVEPYIRMDMSEPSREQTTQFVDGIWNVFSGNIADNRGVEQADVNAWADSLAFTWDSSRYLDSKIVDALKYRCYAEDMIRERLGIDSDDDLPFITPDEYMLANGRKLGGGKKHIAVLYAVGDIVDEGRGGIVGPDVVAEIEDLIDDDDVAGLVLRVNSGGGSAFASEQIWQALERFKETDRPFYVSMGDYAASGGYYISCGADKIMADPTTLTGSIGIFATIPNASRLLKDKIGLGFDGVESSPNASFPSITTPATPEQLAAMQGYVERGYDLFTSRVAEGRGIPQDSVKVIGGGRVWTGEAALKIGLVDQLGSLRSTIEAMAKELDLKNTDYVEYPRTEERFMSVLMRRLSSEVTVDEPLPVDRLNDFVETCRALSATSTLQARAPYILVR